MRGCGGQIRGFTLVEMVVVIAIMALLTSAAALSFSGPLRATRASDAIRQVQSFDDATRQHAKRFGKDLQIVLDLSRDRLIRRQSADGPAMHELQLPHGCRIERVRVGGKVIDRFAIEQDLAGSLPNKAGDDAQQGGLAAARRSEDCHEFAGAKA